MKTILITGSTDGIGFQTAKRLVNEGHNVLIHGRSPQKVQNVVNELSSLNAGTIDSFVSDLTDMKDVKKLANEIKEKYSKLDVLINNAGVYNIKDIRTKDGLDARFVVNTIAPYLLTKELMNIFDNSSRVVNLSSAAQAPVDTRALKGEFMIPSAGEVYAQSKLALTMWGTLLGLELKAKGPMIVSVNPKSFLGSKMVKDAYGVEGADLSIGADILCRGALSSEFDHAHGKYFDNDIAQFSQPHHDALNAEKCEKIIEAIEEVLSLIA